MYLLIKNCTFFCNVDLNARKKHCTQTRRESKQSILSIKHRSCFIFVLIPELFEINQLMYTKQAVSTPVLFHLFGPSSPLASIYQASSNVDIPSPRRLIVFVQVCSVHETNIWGQKPTENWQDKIWFFYPTTHDAESILPLLLLSTSVGIRKNAIFLLPQRMLPFPF